MRSKTFKILATFLLLIVLIGAGYYIIKKTRFSADTLNTPKVTTTASKTFYFTASNENDYNLYKSILSGNNMSLASAIDISTTPSQLGPESRYSYYQNLLRSSDGKLITSSENYSNDSQQFTDYYSVAKWSTDGQAIDSFTTDSGSLVANDSKDNYYFSLYNNDHQEIIAKIDNKGVPVAGWALDASVLNASFVPSGYQPETSAYGCDTLNNFYVFQQDHSNSPGSFGWRLLKFNENGSLLSSKILWSEKGGSTSYHDRDIKNAKFDNQGNLYVGFGSDDLNGKEMIYEYDQTGKQISSYSVTGHSIIRSIATGTQGNLYIIVDNFSGNSIGRTLTACNSLATLSCIPGINLTGVMPGNNGMVVLDNVPLLSGLTANINSNNLTASLNFVNPSATVAMTASSSFNGYATSVTLQNQSNGTYTAMIVPQSLGKNSGSNINNIIVDPKKQSSIKVTATVKLGNQIETQSIMLTYNPRK